jgi:uncharacterized membrane protein
MTPHKELQRIETFSDAIFAIAGTLLILEIKVPHVEHLMEPGALWRALQALWPSLTAYLVSFGTILIAWAGHHRGMSDLVTSSKPFLYANGFVLATITFLPFPTAVLAEYINTPQANVAVMFLSASGLLVSLAFALWGVTMHRPVLLTGPSQSREQARRRRSQSIAGCVLYVVTTGLAYWLPTAALLLIVASQVLWIVVSIDEGSKPVHKTKG